MYSHLVTKLVGCGLLQKETSRSEWAFWAGGGMDVGLSDCQPPKRIPVQGVRSVEPPPASSTALALWCLPLVIGTNCVSIQTSLLLPSSRISLFFDRFYLEEYQKHVFHASCFCLASYAFSKTPVPPLDTPFCLPTPSISSPFPLQPLQWNWKLKPVMRPPSCAVSLAFIWAHGLNSKDTHIIWFILGWPSLFLLNCWPENVF